MTLIAALDHARHEGLNPVNDTHDVDTMDPLPVVDRRLPDVRGGRRNAGVVEEEMTCAVGVVDVIR